MLKQLSVKAVILLFVALCSSHMFADEKRSNDKLQWKLVKDRKGIQIYNRYTENSKIKEFKGVMTVKMDDPKALVAALIDYEGTAKWIHYTHKVERLEEVSPAEHYLRATIKLPWPLRDREVIAHSNVTQHPENLGIDIKFDNADSYRERRDGYVRFPYYRASWRIDWIDENTANLIFESAADPGGYIPLFLVNLITTDVTFFTLRKLQVVITQPEYQNQQFDFLTFPEPVE